MSCRILGHKVMVSQPGYHWVHNQRPHTAVDGPICVFCGARPPECWENGLLEHLGEHWFWFNVNVRCRLSRLRARIARYLPGFHIRLYKAVSKAQQAAIL